MTGKEIKEARLKLGLTQEKFGEKLGSAKRTVQDWESGLRNPSGPAKILIQRMLDEVAIYHQPKSTRS